MLPRVLRGCKGRSCLLVGGDPGSLCTLTLRPQAQRGWCQREENPPPCLSLPLNTLFPTRFAAWAPRAAATTSDTSHRAIQRAIQDLAPKRLSQGSGVFLEKAQKRQAKARVTPASILSKASR